jgi:hypothetical protein
LEIKPYIIAGLMVALAGTACKGKHNAVVQNEEQDTGPRMASVVRMSDPNANTQLLSGFYPVENNSWRWTAGKFSALLRTPLAAAEHGATLTLAFNIPEIVIQKLGTITITPAINGTAMMPSTYKAAGIYALTVDVPTSMLSGESVRADFTLDKSIPPGTDKRELGIIATSIGLTNR